MAEKSVTYFWDVLAWRASRSVQRMTWAAKGMYREMLDEQRDKGSLPDCPRACADLMGGPVEQWIECWPMLRRCFVDRRAKGRSGDDGPHDPSDHDATRRIVNLKMAQTMREQRAYFRRQQTNGRKGGFSKARNHQTEQTLRASKPIAVLQPPASTPVALSSEKIRVEESREEKSRQERTPTRVWSPPMADEQAERAGRFLERYAALYERHRKGARYLGKPALDFQEALQLVATWDDARLDRLATVFLTTDHEFAEKGSRTVAQFRSMASWCDSRLAEAGL